MLEDHHHLRGPVKRVVAERLQSNGLRHETFTFHPGGKLAEYLFRGPDRYEFKRVPNCDEHGREIEPNTEIQRKGDVRIQVQLISADTWSADFLNGLGFGTYGARIAETAFGSDGQPQKTVFRNNDHSVSSQLEHVCEDAGRVCEAVQHLNGAEWFKAILRYDGNGLILKEDVHFGGLSTPSHVTRL